MPDYQGLITRKHLATLLSVDPQTVARYEKRGMPVVHIGPGKIPRYDYEDVITWLQKMEATQDREEGK